jgi:hypothetical protein
MSNADDVALGKRELLRHTVATLAYRAAKAMRDAPPSMAEFRIGDATRTPLQLVSHLGDLIEWAVTLAEGNQKWQVAKPSSWDEESRRFFTALSRLDQYLASERALGCRPEKLLQGPLADALTHVGQIMMLRRLASAPIRSENFAIAEIVAGRVSEDQAAPKFEFD